MSGVPRELVSPDGSLVPSHDKSKLMHIIEGLSSENVDDNEPFEQPQVPKDDVQQLPGERTVKKSCK